MFSRSLFVLCFETDVCFASYRFGAGMTGGGRFGADSATTRRMTGRARFVLALRLEKNERESLFAVIIFIVVKPN
jgi:hypothetical protein